MNIRDVRDSLVNEPLSKALLKAKVLASVLRSEELRTFVNRELEGYSGGDELPSYRITGCDNIGILQNQYERLTDQPIPLSQLPATVREWAEKFEHREGIASLERTIADAAEGQIWILWPNEFVQTITEVVIGGYVYRCKGASKTVTVDILLGIVETVRSRVLDIVLALMERFPEEARTEEALSQIPSQDVRMVFQNIIHGDYASIASSIGVQQAIHVTTADLSSLIGTLRSLGVSDADSKSLETAIENDAVDEKPKWGSAVTKWIGNLATKAAEKSVDVGIGAALPSILAALQKFFT